MRLDTATGDDDVEINLTALIDVVFTLIIFFVVTTSFNNRSQVRSKRNASLWWYSSTRPEIITSAIVLWFAAIWSV
jgi:hypothetical protein